MTEEEVICVMAAALFGGAIAQGNNANDALNLWASQRAVMLREEVLAELDRKERRSQ